MLSRYSNPPPDKPRLGVLERSLPVVVNFQGNEREFLLRMGVAILTGPKSKKYPSPSLK
jgi:hypothetical protein